MAEMDIVRVSKKCKRCGRRLLDKVSPTSGYVKIKCPKCGEDNVVNLALRRQLCYRIAKA